MFEGEDPELSTSGLPVSPTNVSRARRAQRKKENYSPLSRPGTLVSLCCLNPLAPQVTFASLAGQAPHYRIKIGSR